MSGKSVFVYHPGLEEYRFGADHPFNPIRLKMTVSLLKTLGLLAEENILTPRSASFEELTLAHDPVYVGVVKDLSDETIPSEVGYGYGLGTEDNPVFPGMHEASALTVGATLTAVDEVMEGRVDHAINIAGGLHHATRAQASGFCIYNDINVAIRYIRKKYQARVAYIDTDAHHGDGVQWEFYDDPNVLTVSFHETGRYLFPGTGGLGERGRNGGYGYSINVPLEAFTEDESFLETLHVVLPPVLEAFKPDIIISQNGCDAHHYDPLTHLSFTMESYRAIPALVHQLVHAHAGGKWVAVGGGGYDPYRVVPRAWGLLWAELSHQQVNGVIPEAWRSQWSGISPVVLPDSLTDKPGTFSPIPRRQEIREKNLITARKAVQDAVNVLNKFL